VVETLEGLKVEIRGEIVCAKKVHAALARYGRMIKGEQDQMR
jgi:hypothetical protein